jgi:hypothetical protein
MKNYCTCMRFEPNCFSGSCKFCNLPNNNSNEKINIMTEPELKARQIIAQHQLQTNPLNFEQAKHCAFITVAQIFNALNSERIIYGSEYRYEEENYWSMVKQAIIEI